MTDDLEHRVRDARLRAELKNANAKLDGVCQCGEPVEGRCDNHTFAPLGCACHLLLRPPLPSGE